MKDYERLANLVTANQWAIVRLVEFDQPKLQCCDYGADAIGNIQFCVNALAVSFDGIGR